MSDVSHAGEAHAPHAHEVYEGTPADTIPPDEPHTPGWLSVVGVVLVLAGIMAFALREPASDAAPAQAASADPAASVAAAPAPAPRPARPAPEGAGDGQAPRRMALPAGSGAMRLPGLPSGMLPPMHRPAPGPAGSGPRPMPRP